MGPSWRVNPLHSIDWDAERDVLSAAPGHRRRCLINMATVTTTIITVVIVGGALRDPGRSGRSPARSPRPSSSGLNHLKSSSSQ